MADQTSITKQESSKVLIPSSNHEGARLVPVENPDDLICNRSVARLGLGRLILATRPSGSWNTPIEPILLRSLLEENEVTIREAIEAFKRAYSDHFTPASGIEWRHLWKYIELERKGIDRRLYTYAEMLDICDKKTITTDHFERIADDQWKRK